MYLPLILFLPGVKTLHFVEIHEVPVTQFLQAVQDLLAYQPLLTVLCCLQIGKGALCISVPVISDSIKQ